MRTPDRLQPLLEQGVIQEVVRPLMSGKEAAVYLVLSEGELRVAKVYKDADRRSFKHRAAYTEGRKVRNTRQQRAMAKQSRYGREETEAAWRSAEVDAIYRLREAGVAVPEPHAFVEGVLVMELVKGPDGEPAPRLVDLDLSVTEARDLYQSLVREVVKMLCAGVVHGDLSDFNVLLGPDGPVIIDFPQAIDPAHNNNARKLLLRDVRNLTSFLARHDPELKKKRYGEEMWDLYERAELTPTSKLTGKHRGSDKKADTLSLLEEIEAVEREAMKRREALGLPPPRRRTAATTGPAPTPVAKGKAPPSESRRGSPDRRDRDGDRDRGRQRNSKPRPQKEEAEVDPLDALLIIGD